MNSLNALIFPVDEIGSVAADGIAELKKRKAIIDSDISSLLGVDLVIPQADTAWHTQFINGPFVTIPVDLAAILP